ncbi:threonylcarbamoyl-AMP synthase [Acuticoccus sp. M5D2P5]|uniref:L-threonylcarbamoyladenylate synthase n=1 Tax=Acuticoccus kalidii TaxID=2910977 RepID=UPI001F1D3DBC|nr:L-threonylcarbamoyladenylate synthase [Acuticoccus kalidii]MCF3934219.1 threonylcarbamoyl-AMP synthase [Acuticoccus kalidii]
MAALTTATIAAEPMHEAVDRAVLVLAKGGLVALATETVYGLCADATSPAAVGAVFAAKGRPATNPLIVHVASLEDAARFAEISPAAAALAAAFWPGPLTIVLPRRTDAALADTACAGGPTVALRVPDVPLIRAVAARIGGLVGPSANRSGRVTSTSAAAVAEELDGRIDLIVDGGPCPIGVESTVIDMSGPAPAILRPGAVAADEIEAVIGPLAERPAPIGDGPLRSPGLLSSHYAPRARLRLDVEAADVAPDEAWLAFGDETSRAAPERTVRLSPTRDLREAARMLYAGLRALDATGAAVIAVSPIPADGIGAAIRDRLQRAAAPRPEPSEPHP